MKSYGSILKEAREEKSLDMETVSRDTAISIEFIKGLEAEDPAVFPGEPYLRGFLKNYAEYLDVDVDAVMKLYHNKVLQESPVPQELLLKGDKRLRKILVSAIGAFVLAAGLASFFLVRHFRAKTGSDVAVSSGMGPKEYKLSDAPFTGRVFRGDHIIYPAEKGDIALTVSDTLSSFGLSTPVGTLYTDLAEESEIDIDGDAKPDLIVYVSDISASDSDRGAEVRLVLRKQEADIPLVNFAENVAQEAQIKKTHEPVVLLEDNRAYPFTVNANFRGACLFRYKIDRRQSEENYFTNGEIVTVTANNGVRLWMSNSNMVKYTVIADTKNIDLQIGAAGHVLAEDIRWVRNSEGRYRLVVIELD